MAWMLFDLVVEPCEAALLVAKTAAGAVVGYFLKRVWRCVVGSPGEIRRCLVSGCGGVAGTSYRGLCLRCYGKAKKKVEAGEVTWDDLVRMGLCDGVADPFDKAFTKAKSEWGSPPT